MNDFQEQFNRAIREHERKNQYDVSPIPVHNHNGTDSPQVSFPSIANSQNYIVLRTTTLTAAQIKALNTTPQVLIPAFGANTSNTGSNYVAIVEGVTARMYYGGTAYSNSNPLRILYTSSAGVQVTADIPATFLTATANTFVHSPSIATSFTPAFNKPVVITVPTANPGTGNSNVTFVVKYRIVEI